MNSSDIAGLIIKNLNGELSETEMAELQGWMDESTVNRQAVEPFLNEVYVQQGLSDIHVMKERVWEKLDVATSVRVIPFWKKMVAAASIILALGTGAYFMFFNKSGKPDIASTQEKRFGNDIPAPKGTKAMITLADGTSISLDSLTTIEQGNVKVIKNASDEIIYNGAANEVVYNTLSNPRGSKVVSLTLSDGTKVWLNSESSLRYPNAFPGSERKVEITGEAYFEVTKDPMKKFIVSGNGVTTEVLGTYFNVNTFNDESEIKVTLLEGSVKVISGTSSGILKPGQQAQINSTVKVVSGVDVDAVMAWKNGRFELNGNVQGIMKQIARWYDVEIEYVGNVTNKRFGGTLSREENVSAVLKYLELTGSIHFKIDGKKVTVMP